MFGFVLILGIYRSYTGEEDQTGLTVPEPSAKPSVIFLLQTKNEILNW